MEAKDIFIKNKLLERISFMHSNGISPKEIARAINRKIKIPSQERYTKEMVEEIINNVTIKGSEFLKKDADVAKLYKELVMKILNDALVAKDDIKKCQTLINNKLEELKKEGISDVSLISYTREIRAIVRDLLESLRVVDKFIDRLENQKKEVSVNKMATMRTVIELLPTLEKEGFIKIINPDYKQVIEEVKKDNEEIKIESSKKEDYLREKVNYLNARPSPIYEKCPEEEESDEEGEEKE